MSKVEVSTLTQGQAASLVRRMIAKLDDNGKPVLDKDNNPVPVEAGVKEDEVMNFAEYDDSVVVVTTSGEKLTTEKSSDIYKAFAAKQKKNDK